MRPYCIAEIFNNLTKLCVLYPGDKPAYIIIYSYIGIDKYIHIQDDGKN